MLLCLAAFVIPYPATALNDLEPSIPSREDAPIAMLVDVTSGQVLHARNPDRRFVPASITKAMTVFHAFELIEEGRLDPRQVYTLRPQTWRDWAGKGSTMWLGASDQVSVENLLMAIANVSANDGSMMLAEGQAGSVQSWTAGMNARANGLGMENSYFGTPNGWPDEGRTFTTARDLVALAKAMVARHPEKFRQYIGRRSYTFNEIEQFNHDPLIGRFRGADGIKTGYTNEAGFSYLGTAVRDGQRLVMVVAGSPSGRARNRAARNYMEWGFDAFHSQRLFDAGAILDQARVQRGSARRVDLRTDRPVIVNVPEALEEKIAVSIAYDGPLRAPLEDGQEVATLIVKVPGMVDARFPLMTAEPVGEAGFFSRIVNGIAGWFA